MRFPGCGHFGRVEGVDVAGFPDVEGEDALVDVFRGWRARKQAV